MSEEQEPNSEELKQAKIRDLSWYSEELHRARKVGNHHLVHQYEHLINSLRAEVGCAPLQ